MKKRKNLKHEIMRAAEIELGIGSTEAMQFADEILSIIRGIVPEEISHVSKPYAYGFNECRAEILEALEENK